MPIYIRLFSLHITALHLSVVDFFSKEWFPARVVYGSEITLELQVMEFSAKGVLLLLVCCCLVFECVEGNFFFYYFYFLLLILLDFA